MYIHTNILIKFEILRFFSLQPHLPRFLYSQITMKSVRLDELSPFPPDTYDQDEEDLSPTQNKPQDILFPKPSDYIQNEQASPIDIVFIEDSEEEGRLIKKDKQQHITTENKEINDKFIEDASQLSIISIERETSLSGESACTGPTTNKEIGAFPNRQNEYDFEFAGKTVPKDTSPEPTIKEINTSIEILNIQFPLKSVKSIIETLYQRMQTETLPNINKQQLLSDVSYISKHEQSILRSEGSEIELESISGQKEIECSKKGKEKMKEKQKHLMRQQKPLMRHQIKERCQRRDETYEILQELQMMERDKRRERSRDKYNYRSDPNFRNHQRTDEQYLQRLTNDFSQKRPNNIKLAAVKPVFHTEEQRIRYTQKRLVAKAFVRRGYGLVNLRKQLIETNNLYKFDQSRYKSIVHGVVIDTFRRLEEFLEEYCQSFANLNVEKFELRPICTFLLNCRDTLPAESILFIKFMKLEFNVDIEHVVVNRKEAIDLYEKVKNYYHNKEGFKFAKEIRQYRESPPTSFYQPYMKENRANMKYGEQDFLNDDDWSVKEQSELLMYYSELRNISAVRDRYKQKYGPGTIFDDCKLIKSKLFKGLRAAIRKLKAFASEKGELACYSTVVNSLNNDRIKRILISPDALEARVGLCGFYNQKEGNLREAARLIEELEQSIAKIQGRRLSNIDYYGQQM